MARRSGLLFLDLRLKDFFQFGFRDMSRAAAGPVCPRKGPDRRFDAHLARRRPRAPVDVLAQVLAHMRRGRGTDAAEVGWPKAQRCRRRIRAAAACATGCEGTRRPTLSWPPVTKSFAFAERLRISVSGPGQKRSASLRAAGGISRAQAKAASAEAKCTITGWSAGRRLAAYRRATAAALEASAPRP